MTVLMCPCNLCFNLCTFSVPQAAAVVPAVPYKGITYWLEAQTLLKGLHFTVVVGVRLGTDCVFW